MKLHQSMFITEESKETGKGKTGEVNIMALLQEQHEQMYARWREGKEAAKRAREEEAMLEKIVEEQLEEQLEDAVNKALKDIFKGWK